MGSLTKRKIFYSKRKKSPASADLADETADTIRELEEETSPRVQQQLRDAIDRKVGEMIRLLESVRIG